MEHVANGGWGEWWLAAAMIVIASWLLYRYVGPKGLREWSSAGLIRLSSSLSMRK